MKFQLLPDFARSLQLAPEFQNFPLPTLPTPRESGKIPCGNLPPVPQTPASPQRTYFQKMLPYALAAQQLTGIPASVSLAQAALESGWGKHAPGNNFFGIKGRGPAGSQMLSTREYRHGHWVRTRAAFRRYHDPLESFLDHARVISEGRYLRHAMEHRQNAQAFVHALQSGKYRYATDPNYESKLLKLIKNYGLERYDRKEK